MHLSSPSVRGIVGAFSKGSQTDVQSHPVEGDQAASPGRFNGKTSLATLPVDLEDPSDGLPFQELLAPQRKDEASPGRNQLPVSPMNLEQPPLNELWQIRLARAMVNRSLKSVADEAGISVAYLQKLERGQVRSPSPHLLASLAEAIGYPFEVIMAWAGYPCPGAGKGASPSGKGSRRASAKRDVLLEAIGDGELTANETEWLACSLREYRQARAKGVDIPADFLVAALQTYRQANAGGSLDVALEQHLAARVRGRRLAHRRD